MTAQDILTRAHTAGITLSLGPDGAILASPRERLTDDLRTLIRANKPALLAALARVEQREHAHAQGGPDLPADVSHVAHVLHPAAPRGAECMRCANLEMRCEIHKGTRRVFWWRCRRGFALMEGRNYGERVMLAPAECNHFEQWQAGQR